MSNVWPGQHTPYNMDSAFIPLTQTATWANETETPEREVTFCIEISSLNKYYIPQPYDASISLFMGFSTGLYLAAGVLQSNYIDFNLTSENLLPLKKLRTLNFGGTPIVAWTTPIPPLPLLVNLSLSDCSLTKPGPAPFEFPALEILDLSQNYNISLSQNTFTQLRKLKQLILRGCELSSWPTLPPTHFATIDLSGNNFTTLVNLEKQGVTVEVLNMSQNKIFEWDDPDVFLIHANNERFSNLESQFTSLRLEKNRFATPDVKSQKQAPNLHGKTHSSRRATWVQQVNLSLNSISAFTPAMLESLSSLAAVDLGGNHIDCSDCRTPALQSWLRAAGSTVKVLVLGEEGPLRCFLPASLEGAPVAAVQFDASACRDPTVRLRWALGLPLSVALSALLLFGALGFCYRTEVAYLVHLARVRASARRPADLGRCAYDAFVCYRCISKIIFTTFVYLLWVFQILCHLGFFFEVSRVHTISWVTNGHKVEFPLGTVYYIQTLPVGMDGVSANSKLSRDSFKHFGVIASTVSVLR
ncbi:Uncharacterized protein GBIM_15470 [Gryllus bimaculatus]|nr:Uncharacterized protein GBIM_15470 [Gryllus bimaculatus]